MTFLEKDRKDAVADILREHHLSANLDFEEMANKIVSVLDTYYHNRKKLKKTGMSVSRVNDNKTGNFRATFINRLFGI